jgi:hypothetical protein
MNWFTGGSAATSISGNGCYRDHDDPAIALPTAVWRHDRLCCLGQRGAGLVALAVPATHRVQRIASDWTGRTDHWSWDGGGVRVDARTSLPGVLFQIDGVTLALDWLCDVPPVERLDAPSPAWDFRSPAGLDGMRGWRALLIPGPHLPILICIDGELASVRTTNYGRWTLRFAGTGARVLIAPLLDAADIPRDPPRLSVWQELVARPPIQAQERFRIADGAMTIEGRFPDAAFAPLPAAISVQHPATLVRTAGEPIRLLRGAYAPFELIRGETWTATVALDWTEAQLARPAKPVSTDRAWAEVPDELAYAGDATWEPGTAMDQLLALRTWAPLLDGLPADRRAALLPRLIPPSASDVTNAVESIAEARSGIRYARWTSMWAHCGDVSWDTDWYNGLALSGLERASRCSDPAISAAAQATAAACRSERAELMRYFSLFHDWSLCAAWIDPRGRMWNADCIHNGLEGLLAEARLRRAEGDADGAAWMTYLAARTAIGLAAGLRYPAHLIGLRAHQPTPESCALRFEAMTTWNTRTPLSTGQEQPLVAVQCLITDGEVSFATPTTRNPYHLAGDFPEWNALLKWHVPISERRRWAEAFAIDDADRHRDWMAAYCGADWRERRARGDQEAREQAAVFYQVAPEIALRRLALGEDADAIEASWAQALPLSAQALLRGGFGLASGSGAKHAPTDQYRSLVSGTVSG